MAFAWYTSFLGYPNFLKSEGRGHEQASSFLTMADAAVEGLSYTQVKALFPRLDSAAVETKKAAFQEFGLLYVVPRSDRISVTPLGQQIRALCAEGPVAEPTRSHILVALSRGVARYQFNSPLPVGGNRYRQRAQSSDVLPYLSTYYLMMKLDGFLTASELRGALFGLQFMSDLRALESGIRERRSRGEPFDDVRGLPTNEGTAANLKIYFLSHVSLDMELMATREDDSVYGFAEQVTELKHAGFETLESVLALEWPDWRDDSPVPPEPRDYTSIDDYFQHGVGMACSEELVRSASRDAQFDPRAETRGVDPEDEEGLGTLAGRDYEDGRRRLVRHKRLERTRNPALVRAAKRGFKQLHGRLFCEACGFDFEESYGERGRDYIEAHHKVPIGTLRGPVRLTVGDIAVVCANCHRVLHRPPWITLDELSVIVEAARHPAD